MCRSNQIESTELHESYEGPTLSSLKRLGAKISVGQGQCKSHELQDVCSEYWNRDPNFLPRYVCYLFPVLLGEVFAVEECASVMGDARETVTPMLRVFTKDAEIACRSLGLLAPHESVWRMQA